MKILGCKEGHDGSFAIVEQSELTHYLESEKDSFPRCGNITNDLLTRTASYMTGLPDVVAIGGWTKGLFSNDRPTFSGYFGIGPNHEETRDIQFFGEKSVLFSSTHEASHIWNAYSMSPFEQGQPCYVLVWEGNVGNFYYIDEKLKITDLGSPMTDPGNRYTFIFSLADLHSPDDVGYYDTSHPGKMMALAAFGNSGQMNPQEQTLWDLIKNVPQFQLMSKSSKSDYSDHFLYNTGVETKEFKDFARKVTDDIFSIFLKYAKDVCKVPSIPLLISGGCGLNCEWNSRWLSSGLFSDIFIPPCCNDSGSAAGTAAHAMFKFTGNAKLDWSVYSGEHFVDDAQLANGAYERKDLTPAEIGNLLEEGKILGWIEGKYEIGPRALGHRSILASAHRGDSLDKLNHIKRREPYRPVAPIAIESSLELFSPPRKSPYMLFFHEVLSKNLPAVTHVDGSARLQTLKEADAPYLYDTLLGIKETTGAGVLCNTSLNYPGKGFINRSSDLVDFARSVDLDGYIVNGTSYVKSS